MKKIEILSLPQVQFAHIHRADNFSNSFSANNDFIEVCYIKQGNLTLSHKQKVYNAYEGDIVCIVPTSEITVSSDCFHCHHVVRMNVLWEQLDETNALSLPILTKASHATEEITKNIDKFIYEPYLFENSFAKAATVLLNILYKINSIHINEKKDTHPSYSLLSMRAKKYIHKNIYKHISQTEVANFLGITPQYLCNIFKKAEGISLIKYINTTKLQKIQAIMQIENLKLHEAAQIFGYSDANYVSNLYKKTFGRNITSKPNLSDESK